MDKYPEIEELEQIKNWSHESGWKALMDFIESIWWMPEWGFSRRGKRYDISTGGWSGNEEIIKAMTENFIFWSMCWVSTRRGGHFVFKLPAKPKEKTLATPPTA